MTWTYEENFDLPRDQVRLYLNDIDTNNQLVSDEVIAFLLTEEGDNPLLAAARAADVLAAKYSRMVSFSADGISFQADELQERFSALAKALRGQVGGGQLAAPYFGGASKREMAEDLFDFDLIPLHFGSHMHDHPGSGGGHPDRNESGWDPGT